MMAKTRNSQAASIKEAPARRSTRTAPAACMNYQLLTTMRAASGVMRAAPPAAAAVLTRPALPHVRVCGLLRY
jgi:hypothetical protein